jgi:FkbM family methyltransferase
VKPKVTASPRTIFDQSHYVKIIEARGETIRRVVSELKPALELSTALDAGCGIGFFSETLRESGLQVHAFDGRAENVEEARKRFPQIPFEQGDIESSEIRRLGEFDLVLCFGLLYHLENPLRAIRHLRSLTGKVLLLESMCLPTDDLRFLLREEPDSADQSLTDLAFYPSEGSITKMLLRAGFKYVYRIAALPDHDEFRDTPLFTRRRTMVLSSFEPVLLSGLIPLDEPREIGYPWQKSDPPAAAKNTDARAMFKRINRFLRKPLHEQSRSFYVRWRRLFPNLPLPVRLPFGAWWLARNDHVSKPIVEGTFEAAEIGFLNRFLRLGMTVLDLGAHHGFYTLLASKRVGSSGNVFAFEPSPREREALRLHLRMNRCKNVVIQEMALGDQNMDSDLYVVEAWAAGCNSLRPPDVAARTSTVSVHMVRLDDWLAEHKIDQVDFIKLDVEGAELPVLRGASQLLSHHPRPMILAEVQDIRTAPWGYRAREIVALLERLEYSWFQPTERGGLRELDTNIEDFDLNLVAVPKEQMQSVLARINAPDTGSED